MTAKRLLVLVPDYLSAIITKGECQPRYYNPGNVFEEVHILMTNDDRPDLLALQRMVGRARLFVHNVPEDPALPHKPWDADDARLLREWAEPAVRIARAIRPQLMRCHGADLNTYLALRIRQELGIPYVVSLHINPDVNPTRRFSETPAAPEQGRINRFFEYIEDVSLRGADLVMPVYRPVLPYLDRLGVERREVCYNVLSGEDLRRKESYALGRPVRAVCVGRLFEDKDPGNILRALVDLPDVKLTIVGDGPLRPSLESLVRTLGIEKRIMFRPAVPNTELCRSLPDYDLFVVHTEYWELNKSVLEALLTGLPVVINHRKGLPVPELEGDFVLKVDNTPDAYRAAIAGLIDDDMARAALGRRAGGHARAHWDPALTERKYVEIYERFMIPD